MCMIIMFLQDPQTVGKGTVYAGISKSMYAGSVLSLDCKYCNFLKTVLISVLGDFIW